MQILENNLSPAQIKETLLQLRADNPDGFLDKLTETFSRTSALLNVMREVSEPLALDLLFQRMVKITTEIMRSDRGTIFLFDARSHELYARIAQGEGTQEIRFPSHLGIAGTVFTHGEAVIIPDAYADDRFNPEVDKKTGYRTRNILCAPICTREGERIGVVQVLNKDAGDYEESDLRIIELITTQAAATLQNAQLLEQLQKAKEEEARLLEMTTSLSSELQLEPLLQKIMGTTTDLLDADRSTLFMHDTKTQELWSIVAQGSGSFEIRFPCHLGIAGRVFTSGETINIPDAYADDRFNPEVDKKTGYRTRNILCMPMHNKKGERIGVFQVLNKAEGPFLPADEKRLEAFAAQASIAIENAKLFDEVLNVKNYNESILESLNDGVLTLDDAGQIVKCNVAAGRIFLLEPEEILAHDAQGFFGGDNGWILESIERVTSSQEPENLMDTDLFLHDQSKLSINLQTIPLLDAQHASLGTLLVFEDITQEKRLKGTMARYMTKEVAERLLESGEAILGGHVQNVSVLFSDIRRFTSITEEIGAQETVSMLNDYFSLMVDIIFRYQGILDKYIGDAIMAVFGTPFSTPEDADHAVLAAVDMLRSLKLFNSERKREGKSPLEIGIGINTGEVISGNIGSMKRMDYTVIGDGVNLAARLESANKYYKTQLLISEFTFRQLLESYACREVDLIRVKGKNEPVAVYEILDYIDENAMPQRDELLECFALGLSLYRQRQWERAREHFQTGLKMQPDDGVCPLYIARCDFFLEEPPPADWDGVWTMKTK